MAKFGGKQQGSGNKAGSTRPHITHYWSQKDITEYFTWLKGAYKEKPELAKWVGDQISGKAHQAVDLTSGGKPLLINDLD